MKVRSQNVCDINVDGDDTGDEMKWAHVELLLWLK